MITSVMTPPQNRKQETLVQLGMYGITQFYFIFKIKNFVMLLKWPS
jgi:hypothetical protein